VVYPLGIATIVPASALRSGPSHGRFISRCSKPASNVPGFRVEIQGVYKEVDAQGRIGLYTYVVTE